MCNFTARLNTLDTKRVAFKQWSVDFSTTDLFRLFTKYQKISYLVILFRLFLTQRAQNKLLIIQIHLPDRLIRLVNNRAITTFAHLVSSPFVIFPRDFLPSGNFACVDFRISSSDFKPLVWRNGQRDWPDIRTGIFCIWHDLLCRITHNTRGNI